MKIDFKLEELKFIEKVMDNQASDLLLVIRKQVETFMIANATTDIGKDCKKLVFRQIEELARTDQILKNIRSKCETIISRHCKEELK